MNADLVRNWLKKAENDLKIGRDEMQTDEPATDMVSFHMEQCVEKYLKAYLTFHRKSFRRTHDIAELIELCAEITPEFRSLYELGADSLTVYGVEVRYPDEFYIPTDEEAQASIRIAESVREFVQKRLKDAGFPTE
ncbi:HEPN domain-containing protein [Candidatus Bipolaricaulota bacterium]|nr:HEPN domain-containing protein [Candidatus Bipolaricaulota bacterium]